MKKTTILIFAFIVAFSGQTVAQVKADGQKAYEHVLRIASDEFQGRKSGTPGYAKAAEYVADKIKEYGLRPGGKNGTWFQEVPFKNWSNYDQPIRLEIVSPLRRVYFAGRNRDFTPVSGTGSGIVRGEVAFAGYGISSEKPAWNDYDGLDVKGRILIVLPDAPSDFGDSAGRDWTLEKKVKLAAEKGAVGLIEMDLSDPGRSPSATRRRVRRFIKQGECPPNFVVMQAGRNFLDDLFYSVRSSWREPVSRILRQKRPHSFLVDVAVEMEAHFVQEDRKACNVIALLPGRDKKLKDEFIIMGGHLDHLGIGLDGFIYNGADDNAVSAGTLLETARVLIASGFKPARSILFCFWAGEELGLIGSRYYAAHPLYPLEKTVVYLNVDMVGMGDPDLLVGGMWEYGRFYDLLKPALDPEIAKKLKPRLNYRGSDHSAFWAKGVTALSLRTGEILTGELDDEHPEYHRPGDRPEVIDPELLRLSAQYHIDIIRFLAQTKEDMFDPRFRAEFIHKDAVVVDLHCDTIGRFMNGEDLRQDLPKGHIDIPKLKRGAMDLQVFACFVRPPAGDLEKAQAAKKVFQQIGGIRRLVDQSPDDLEIVRTHEEAMRLRNSGKTGILIGIEGGYAIDSDLDMLRTFYRTGVRLITLTHWTDTDWADASGDPIANHGGLTSFGEQVIKEMNTLGMVIDVSHVHDETFWDVIQITKAPAVASHSCCRALADHHRNLSDEMLKALAKNNGVVGINFHPGFLNAEIEKKYDALLAEVTRKHGLAADFQAIRQADDEIRNKVMAEFEAKSGELQKTLPRVDVKTVVDHIDHVVKVTGYTDHVGLGSDFDGISSTPEGLENVGLIGAITEELQRRGYEEGDIRKILGGNFLRVFQAVEKAAKKADSE
ncbi:MAG: membrane dipeptidase [Candidatus Aminicenantales bacterium]